MNGNFEVVYNSLLKSGEKFKLLQSNTSITIIHNKKRFSFFTENKNMFPVFALLKKIKKNIDENETKFLQDRKDCEYNSFNRNVFLLENDDYYYIDVSACYLTIAKNIGMISQELYDSCILLKKEQRLIILGLLAYNPTIFEYENGKEIACYRSNSKENKDYNEEKDYSQNFFRLVRETDKIFLELEKILGDDFIFFWVDGICFRYEKNVEIVSKFLEKNNLTFKKEIVKEIKITNNNSYTSIELKKIDYKTDLLVKKEYLFSNSLKFENKVRNEVLEAIKNMDGKKISEIFKNK